MSIFICEYDLSGSSCGSILCFLYAGSLWYDLVRLTGRSNPITNYLACWNYVVQVFGFIQKYMLLAASADDVVQVAALCWTTWCKWQLHAELHGASGNFMLNYVMQVTTSRQTTWCRWRLNAELRDWCKWGLRAELRGANDNFMLNYVVQIVTTDFMLNYVVQVATSCWTTRYKWWLHA